MGENVGEAERVTTATRQCQRALESGGHGSTREEIGDWGQAAPPFQDSGEHKGINRPRAMTTTVSGVRKEQSIVVGKLLMVPGAGAIRPTLNLVSSQERISGPFSCQVGPSILNAAWATG